MYCVHIIDFMTTLFVVQVAQSVGAPCQWSRGSGSMPIGAACLAEPSGLKTPSACITSNDK